MWWHRIPTLSKDLELICSALISDHCLRIQSLGRVEEISLQLDGDLQLSFFIDSMQTSDMPLIMGNVHDLRLTKSSNSCALSNQQWAGMRAYFHELILQANTDNSLFLITRLIQERLVQISTPTNRSTMKAFVSPYERFHGAGVRYKQSSHDPTDDHGQVSLRLEMNIDLVLCLKSMLHIYFPLKAC